MGRRIAYLFVFTTILSLSHLAWASTPAELRQDISHSPSDLSEPRPLADPLGPGPLFYGLPSLSAPAQIAPTVPMDNAIARPSQESSIYFSYDDPLPDDAPSLEDDAIDDAPPVVDEPTDPEDLNLSVAYVPWDYIPVVELLEAPDDVAGVDAQGLLNDSAADIDACFRPRHFGDQGSLVVDLYLAESGTVQGVQGHHHRLAPDQARCILRLAWDYRFPRLSDTPRDVAHLRYRVQIVAQPADDRRDARPRLLLQDLRHIHDPFRAPLADALTDRLPDMSDCAALSLDQLGDDATVADIQAHLEIDADGTYRIAHHDLTLTNQDSHIRPSPDLLTCYQDHLRQWSVDLDDLDTDDLPSTLTPHFAITFEP